MKVKLLITSLMFLTMSVHNLFAGEIKDVEFIIDAPEFGLRNVPFSITITARNSDGSVATDFHEKLKVEGIRHQELGKLDSTARFVNGELVLSDIYIHESGTKKIRFTYEDTVNVLKIRIIPGILSLLPPIIAIVLALLFKQVLIALFSGIWLGAIFLNGYNPFIGFMRALDTFLIEALAEPSHAAIVTFSMTLGGMVGVISKAGGAQGIVEKLSRFANNRRGGQLATWAMGVLIFFDDYANTLIVGNTMRPFTDNLRISREKLSYIVDSTAAPIASVAIISSWVGFQIGLIDQSFETLNIVKDPYITFLQSIPYASYSVLAIVFVFMIGFSQRDMFSMLQAEQRSFTSGKVLRDGAQPIADSSSLDIEADSEIPLRWYNALIPIMTVIVVTIFGLYYSGLSELGDRGYGARLGEIIGAADSFDVLMWSAFIGAIVAIVLAVSQKILTLQKALDAWLSGVKAMVIAMIILVLAWAIGNICAELKTADYVIHLIKGYLSPHYLPVLTFFIAAFIGFSTGTSWATMAILVPIVIPAAIKLSAVNVIDPSTAESILLGTIGSVLSGSVFGDHCSPISDTTIMSSMASAADHIDHVRTQLPYAVLVGIIASVIGYLPSGFGITPVISIAGGVFILTLILFLFGKKMK
ncbi:Na+/H+ antiporter NhaC family protein [candidate division KSB1 bacterium]|nr:Na+/H+ antiporter NhaC family protein [candidate division KSB1 bacterium]